MFHSFEQLYQTLPTSLPPQMGFSCDTLVRMRLLLVWRRGCTRTLLTAEVPFTSFVPKLQQLFQTHKWTACFPIKMDSFAIRPFLEIRYTFQRICFEALGYLNHFLVYFPRHKRYHVWNMWNENVKVFGWILSAENIFAYCSFSVKILK